MTKTNMDLSELVSKHDHGDFLRCIAEAVLQLIVKADVESPIGAGRNERSCERTTWRNGYRERALDTRLGTLNLRVPKLRQGSCFPGFLEARKTSEQALVAVIQGKPAGRRRFKTAGERHQRRLDPSGGRVVAGHGA
jgi:transposase-like protein